MAPVVKGGVWTNVEDEVLKAAVSKYGLNQWARVSSLLARKTPKQCKARWQQWLDPAIRKVEWSKDEDEKLLHLAKLMPTQWNTIAPIVGRTAQQCLERYQRLLDDAESRESDEFGLMGPEGGEGQAPSADDVRRLRPGEMDPDPETKPARPDTIDMDEDEKEMLSEARARLANTQGKKAKRKARERQLEESRRLASLQKRRELKTAGINIKINTRKPGEMDYNADIPFEKAPAAGFHDTINEMRQNEREREAFDPRKKQLQNKRKNDDDEEGKDRKKKKTDEANAAQQAAQRAGQLQRIRDAERNAKRTPLRLSAPQVSDVEMENIVKMGMSGDRAIQNASDSDSTRGLVGEYSNMTGQTPIRTPMAPKEEDRVANEVRNARARTETQSALLGGDNPEYHETAATTGYQGATPTARPSATPNPMATPFRGGPAGSMAPPPRPGQTPMRTPRDNFRLNDQTPRVGQTPREVKMAELATRNSLASRLAALPKPKETDWELELPEEQMESVEDAESKRNEDAAYRKRREEELRKAQEEAEFKRQTQVFQRGLPRPSLVNISNLKVSADPLEALVDMEMKRLITHDISKTGSLNGNAPSLERFSDDLLDNARSEIAFQVSSDRNGGHGWSESEFAASWELRHAPSGLPGLAGYLDEEADDDKLSLNKLEVYREGFEKVKKEIIASASASQKVEKKLNLHLGGYQKRAKMLRQKMAEAADAFEKVRLDVETSNQAAASEDAAIASRLEALREEVRVVASRERMAQEGYRARKEELGGLGG